MYWIIDKNKQWKNSKKKYLMFNVFPTARINDTQSFILWGGLSGGGGRKLSFFISLSQIKVHLPAKIKWILKSTFLAFVFCYFLLCICACMYEYGTIIRVGEMLQFIRIQVWCKDQVVKQFRQCDHINR